MLQPHSYSMLDIDQIRELLYLKDRYKIQLQGMPSPRAMLKDVIVKPLYIDECALCLTKDQTLAHPHLTMCLKCARNTLLGVNAYKYRSVTVLNATCERCFQHFTAGVRSYNVRLCSKCLARNWNRNIRGNFF